MMSIPISIRNQVIRPAWLPFLIIAGVSLALAVEFLLPTPWEFPMDDTYIHFVYAQNLAERGELVFNAPGETGVGTTSLTWVLLLAGAYRFGVPLHLAAKILGLMSLMGAGFVIFLLLQPLVKPLPALAFALLVTGSGHLLWFSLSGMETVLFLALGMIALLLYRQRRWVFLGIILGLLALTRPDGLSLAAAIVTVELGLLIFIRSPQQRGNFFITLLVCFLICAPWFGYLFLRTGNILPTSALGKQMTSQIAIQLVTSRSPIMSALAEFPPLIYMGAWVSYLLEFVLGGTAMPGPGMTIGESMSSAGYSIAYLGILGWFVIILPLLISFIIWLREFSRDRRLLFEPYRPWLAFSAWVVLHNLAYAFFLPIPGTASRYGAINHIALWLALFIGLLRFAPRSGWFYSLAAGLLFIACANTLYWNRVYDANLEHMRDVRIAASRYITHTIPSGEHCAAFDVGTMRFYSQRPILDLGGLIDPVLGEVYRSESRIDRYLSEREITCVILPGQTGTTQQGWFDFAHRMGLTTSPYFTIRQEKVFAIDRERWLLGYLPTNNYQATVTIYRLERP